MTTKKNPSKLTSGEVNKIAKLANLPLNNQQGKVLADQVISTVDYVSQLAKVNTDNTPETSQVTGLENVLREDVIDTKRMFTQEKALANAKNTHKGFFVVDRILEEK